MSYGLPQSPEGTSFYRRVWGPSQRLTNIYDSNLVALELSSLETSRRYSMSCL